MSALDSSIEADQDQATDHEDQQRCQPFVMSPVNIRVGRSKRETIPTLVPTTTVTMGVSNVFPKELLGSGSMTSASEAALSEAAILSSVEGGA